MTEKQLNQLIEFTEKSYSLIVRVQRAAAEDLVEMRLYDEKSKKIFLITLPLHVWIKDDKN